MPALPAFILSFLAAGCTTVLPHIPGGRLEKAPYSQVLRQMDQEKVEMILASPFFIEALAIAQLSQKPRKSLVGPLNDHFLKKIFTGGGSVTPALVRHCQQAFPQAQFVGVYGSSEAEPIAHISGPEILDLEPQTAQGGGLPAGWPIGEIDLTILQIVKGPLSFDEQSHSCLELPSGEIGEIVVRGPHVNTTYLHDPEAILQNKIPDGETLWHRTGDAGYLDVKGRLWICGRVMSRWLGPMGYVYPACIEEALKAFRLAEEAVFLPRKKESPLLLLRLNTDQRAKEKHSDDVKSLLEKLKTGEVVQKVVFHIFKDARHRTKIDRAKCLEKYG